MTVPVELQDLFARSSVEDRSFSAAAKTYQLTDGARTVFVKLAPTELLERERLMSGFLHGFGLAPEVIDYGIFEDGAYLVTAALPGRNGIAAEHLSEPRHLAVAFGEALRRLHELPVEDCPVKDRDRELRKLAETNLTARDYDPSHIPEALEKAAARLHESSVQDIQVVLHGDYCLPNILFENFQLTGFVDLGNGGAGGRHYDLYWGVFTLEYNLKSSAYKDLFLDAYGRSLVVPELLDYNRIISGLT